MSAEIRALAVAAKSAARTMAATSNDERDAALEAVAAALDRACSEILAANREDLAAAQPRLERGGLTKATVDRLTLTPAKLAAMSEGVRAVARLPDPIGRVLERIELDNGLQLEKVSTPIGLLAAIFEARPDAITQISSLAIKSANGVILKPGSEVERTARAVVGAIRAALRGTAVPEAAVTNVQQRAEVDELLKLDDLIDLVIPRGGYELVRHVQSNTRIPVLGHSEGVCHIYVDAQASFGMALNIIDDAKTDYPAACNAVETVLVHRQIAGAFIPLLAKRMIERGVRLRGCSETVATLRDANVTAPVESVRDDEWHAEYGDLILAIRVVPDMTAAMEHIAKFGSAHTDAIVTGDQQAAERFLQQVDSAGVYHNASTRFADGYRYGFGAEVGISISRLHARGPVGLAGLTTYKYILRGAGQVARDYQGPQARPFAHARRSHSAGTGEGESS